MRFKSFRSLCLAGILLLISNYALAQGTQREGEGWLETRGGQLVVHLKGSPYEMGYQHGVLLKDHVIAVYNDYIVALGDNRGMFTEEKLLTVSQKYLLDYLSPEMAEELRGIADGSGLEYEKVFAMQTFLDVLSVLWSNSARGLKYLNGMCSSIAVRAPGSKNGELIHARNTDFPDYGVLSSHAVLFVYNPDQGHKMAIAGWAGLTGALTGMNNAGVTLSEDTLSTRDDDIHGVPIMILLRQALQQAGTAGEMRDYIQSQPRTTGYMVLTTSPGDQQVVLMEFNPKIFAAFEPDQSGIIFATNNPRDKAMKSIWGDMPNSLRRYERWEMLTSENGGQIDAAMMKTFLQDTFDTELDRFTEADSNTICRANNIQSAIFLPETLEFMLAQGTVPAAQGEWVEYSFDELFGDGE